MGGVRGELVSQGDQRVHLENSVTPTFLTCREHRELECKLHLDTSLSGVAFKHDAGCAAVDISIFEQSGTWGCCESRTKHREVESFVVRPQHFTCPKLNLCLAL